MFYISWTASVARKKRSVFRDNMCTWLTALAVLRYAPDYGDFGDNNDVPGMRFASSRQRLQL